jgi:hypothetical protein
MHRDETHRRSHDACNDEHENVRAESRRLRLEQRDEPDHDNPDGDEILVDDSAMRGHGVYAIFPRSTRGEKWSGSLRFCSSR